MISDYGKLSVLVLGLLTGAVVVVIGVVTHDQVAITTGTAIIGPIIGYVTGNGVLARRGDAPSPVIVPTDARIVRRVDQLAADAYERESEP